MIHVMVRIQVEDFDRFWEGFQTRGLALRTAHGSGGAQVFRHADDSHRVTLLFQWESRERFQGFLDDPAVQESMKKGGTLGPPEVSVLDRAGELTA
jgi:heme-degrading monooxygenase HmoA